MTETIYITIGIILLLLSVFGVLYLVKRKPRLSFEVAFLITFCAIVGTFALYIGTIGQDEYVVSKEEPQSLSETLLPTE